MIKSCIYFAITILIHQAAWADDFDAPYRELLAEHVNDKGEVDYASLQKNRSKLDAYVTALGRVSKKDFTAMSKDAQVALLVNAYNAITLKVIIDHYPIKPNWKTRLLYPNNSIRQIPGAWKKIKHPVVGRDITLYDLENAWLRKDYDAPGIHMALVCASISCPWLRNEPYSGARLKEQFADQARGFFTRKDGLVIDGDTISISPLFKWFPEDFLAYKKAVPADQDDAVNAALNYAAAHLDEKQAAMLLRSGLEVKYLDYNWALNEQ